MSQFLAGLTATGGFIRVRAAVLLTLTSAMVYLWINGDPVPSDLQKAWFTFAALYVAPRIMTEATTAAHNNDSA